MASAESGVVALPLVSLLLCTEQTIPEYFPIIKTMTPKIHSIEQPWVVFCMNAAFTGCVTTLLFSDCPRPLKTELLFWNLILTTENPRRHCGQAQRSFLSPWKSIKWGNSIAADNCLIFGDERGNELPLFLYATARSQNVSQKETIQNNVFSH